jgi:hypothetical protein
VETHRGEHKDFRKLKPEDQREYWNWRHNHLLISSSYAGSSMSRGSIGRILLAVAAGYLANSILVAVTEQLLSLLMPGVDATPPLRYFVLDLISQSLYTMAGGYLCCRIARPSQRAALVGLIVLGLVVGMFSLAVSWKTEPHWYRIALLAVYPPCAWAGWILGAR